MCNLKWTCTREPSAAKDEKKIKFCLSERIHLCKPSLLCQDHYSLHLQLLSCRAAQFSVSILTPALPLSHQAPSYATRTWLDPSSAIGARNKASSLQKPWTACLSWARSSRGHSPRWDTTTEKCKSMWQGRLQLTQMLAIFPHLRSHVKLFQYPLAMPCPRAEVSLELPPLLLPFHPLSYFTCKHKLRPTIIVWRKVLSNAVELFYHLK